MPDVVLVQNGIAWQVWPGTTIAALAPFYHPSLVAAMVEVPTGTVQDNYTWDGAKFTAPVAP